MYYVLRKAKSKKETRLLVSPIYPVKKGGFIYDNEKAAYCSRYIFTAIYFFSAITNVLAGEPGKISQTAIQ